MKIWGLFVGALLLSGQCWALAPPAARVQARILAVDGEAGAIVEPVELVTPRYTEIAWKARVSGTVNIEAQVAPEGQVVRATITEGLPMGLGDQAIAKRCPATAFGISTRPVGPRGKHILK